MAKTVGLPGLIEVWADTGLIVEPSGATIASGWLVGDKPPAQYMNWVQNTFATKINHMMQHGVPRWSADTVYGIGDFVSEGGTIYKATAADPAAIPPSTGWAAVGESAGAVPSSRVIGVGGIATGGGDLTADRTVTVTESSSAQATAGVDGSTAMTPRRTAEAIASLGAFSGKLLHVRDEKPSGTIGGASVAGSFVVRDLNSILTNEIAGASLSANRVTLPAGEYWIDAHAPGNLTGLHKILWRNITLAADVLVGTSEGNVADSGSAQTTSRLRGRFATSGVEVFELQHRTSLSAAAGLGRAAGFGVAEVYADVAIWKVG